MKFPVLLLTLLLLTPIPASFAGAPQPVVNLSWNGCTGPTDRIVLPGQAVSVYASVLGQSEPHKAYQVQLRLANGQPALPDAWRFDVGGCQGPTRLTIDHLAPPEIAKACPSFQGTLASVQLKEYVYDALTGQARTFVFNTYPNAGLGNTTEVNPAQRYFLARWTFDHAISVAGPGGAGQCGNLDVPICIAAVGTGNAASWVALDGSERPWAFQNEFVTSQDIVGCFPIPARNSTWGAIKGQYR